MNDAEPEPMVLSARRSRGVTGRIHLVMESAAMDFGDAVDELSESTRELLLRLQDTGTPH